MGYRSDVAIAIYGETTVIAPLIAAHRLNSVYETDYLKDANIYEYRRSDTAPLDMTMICVEYQSTKWYDGYELVKAWESLVENANNHEEVNAEKVIIGEDYSDVTLECDGPDPEYYLGIHREINTENLPLKEGVTQ